MPTYPNKYTITSTPLLTGVQTLGDSSRPVGCDWLWRSPGGGGGGGGALPADWGAMDGLI